MTLVTPRRACGLLAVFALALGGAQAFAQQASIQAIASREALLYAAGNYSAALVEAQKYEAAVKARFGTGDVRYAAAITMQASIALQQGRLAAAEQLFKQALPLYQRIRGPDDAVVAATLGSLARTLASEGRLAEAEALYKRALAISERRLGPDAPPTTALLNNLAMVDNADGFATSEALIKRAIAVKERTLGPNSPAVAVFLGNLASMSDREGKYESRGGDDQSRRRHYPAQQGCQSYSIGEFHHHARQDRGKPG